jgi:predicted RNA-binding protein YlxR (DUF448 family)
MARQDHAAAPQRTCLACRTSREKNLLLRFVLSPDSEVLPDPEMRLPGRGAYTCMSAACLAKAVEQRQFKRAFKQDVTVMTSGEMLTHVRRQLVDRVTGLIGMANKAGKITGGGSMVSDALRSKLKPGLVLLAADVSAAIGEKIILLASVQHVPLFTVLTKEDFGSILGKAPRSAISIAAGGFVVPLRTAIERYVNFLGEV